MTYTQPDETPPRNSIDVDGTIVWIDGEVGRTVPARQAEMRQMVESIQFD